MSSTVSVGNFDDVGETYTVTVTRDPADTTTDYTTASSVNLLLPGGTTQAVTKTSATASQWVGTVKYTAWWPRNGDYEVLTQVHFASGDHITVPTPLRFAVGRAV